MITFNYIEDYLEVLAGYREVTVNGKCPGPINIFGGHQIISLARYDTNIISSMANQTMTNVALTDRQSELAIRLVDKYKRQFLNHGVDVAPSVRNPTFRVPVRVVDRSRTISLLDDSICIRFPYDKEMVPEITAAAKESQGKYTFDKDNKRWTLALTEHNVNWATSFGKKHGFTIDDNVQKYMDLILGAEKTPYKIELTITDQGLTVSNAAPSLIDYINKRLGGFDVFNLIKLADCASVLGYTIDDGIVKGLAHNYSSAIVGLLTNKSSHITRIDPTSTGEDAMKIIIDYATLSNRWPIYIYEPDASNRLRNTVKKFFDKTQLADLTDYRKADEVDLTGIKCVYLNKLKLSWQEKIPLLVSTNAMLHGGEKQAVVQITEKIVYYTATVYNKEATTIAGDTDN